MTKFYKWLLFISSYAPLYVLIAVDNYDFKQTPYVYFNDVWVNENHLVFWLTIVVLLIVSLLAVSYFKWRSLNDSKMLVGLKPLNENILSYLIMYVIPLTAMDIANVNSLIVNLILFIVIGIVYVNSNLVYLNILLILMGFRVYSDAHDNVIITNFSKDEITSSKVDGKKLPSRMVTNGIYLVRKQKQ